MARLNAIGRTAIAALLLGSTAAHADVSAQDVWGDWKTLLEGYGQTTTVGSEIMSGDTLMVKDLTLMLDTKDAQITSTIDFISFKERSDGTVEITMSDTYPLLIKAEPESGKPAEITIMTRTTGLSIVASGDSAQTTYSYVAPSISLILDKVTADGKPVDAKADIMISNTTGSYVTSGTDIRSISSRMKSDGVTFDVAVVDPDGQGSITFAGTVSDLASTSNGTVAMLAPMTDLSAMLKSGFSTDGTFTHGVADYSYDFQSERDAVAVSGSSTSGNLSISMNEEKVAYGGETNGNDIIVKGSSIPFPEIRVKMAQYAFDFLMPIAKSDTPADFSLMTRLVDLTISDEIWGMFDPASVLPRDPATVSFDIKGKGNWLVDVMDPEVMAATNASGETPGELHALTLNDLTIAIAGALLTGTGDFTFDNSDRVTFNGMPAPTGGVELQLVGGNGLLDKLVQMGLLPNDQATGVRMMLGLFARPGSGEDTLVSTIEVNADGSVLANGQRLK